MRVKQQKQHSQKQSNKKSNENSSTVCAQKKYSIEEKTQGKLGTSEKNVFERKMHSAQTAKAPKDTRKTKEYHEAGQPCPKQVDLLATKKFRFQFLKKSEPIRIFKKKIRKFLLVEKIGGIPPMAHSLDLAKRINESGAQKLCA